ARRRRESREGRGVKPPQQGPIQPGRADKTLPTPDPSQVQLIRSYGPGRFLIGQREWRSAVLVTPGATFAWSVTRAEDLALDTLAPLKEAALPTAVLGLGCV